MKRRSYKLVTPRGTTSKRFFSLIEAYRFLKPDCPDLVPRMLLERPLQFADGYSFERADL